MKRMLHADHDSAVDFREKPIMSNPCRLFWIGIICAASSLYSPPARGQVNTPTKTWVPNSSVFAVARTTDTIYLGGDFTKIAPFTGSSVPISAATGRPILMPEVNRYVYACEPDGMGGWFIGGNFTKIGSVNRTNLAHIFSDGTVDPAFNRYIDLEISDLELSGSKLFVAGSFRNLGGGFLAALDATTGAVLPWNPRANWDVSTIAVSGTTLYAGGSFTSMGGQTRNYLAAVDTNTGNVLSWNPNPNGVVLSLAVSGSRVYIGGTFTTMGGFTRRRLAAVNTSGTHELLNLDADSGVSALAVSGSTLYAGGNFTTLCNQPRSRIGAVDTATGNATSWNPPASDDVFALSVSNGIVYAGGLFTWIGGQQRNRLAAIDAASGIVTGWNPDSDAAIWDVVARDGVVYVGGICSMIGGVARQYLAALDARTGEATAWNPGANGRIYALAHSGTKVYVGGSFSSLGGHFQSGFGIVDAATGTVGGPSISTVRAMALTSSTLYLGYDYGLCALDLASDTLLPWSPSTNSSVYAVAVGNGAIYAGGLFDRAGGQIRNRVAAFDTAGNLLPWNPNASSYVYALAFAQGRVFAGGNFTNIGGQYYNSLAALDPVTGAASSWNIRTSNQVHALAVSSSTLYVGGSFGNVAGQDRINVAALDIARQQVLPWNPRTNDYVRAISAVGDFLCIGGSFTTIGDSMQTYFAKFDTPPVEPSNPGCSGAWTDRLTWTWQDNSDDETGFGVWSDPGSGATTTLRHMTGENQTSWTQGALTTNTQYSFQVAALKGGAVSLRTNPMTTWTLIEPVVGFTYPVITSTTIQVTPANAISNISAGSSGIMFNPGAPGATWRQTLTPYVYTGLTPNAPYAISAKTRNGAGIETTPYTGSCHTLATRAVPGVNIDCSIAVQTPRPVGSNFVFSNPAGFGSSINGGSVFMVSAYRYAWDTRPTHAYTGAEAEWSSGNLSLDGLTEGAYYLHLLSLNAEGVKQPWTLNFGPFPVMTPPQIVNHPSSIEVAPGAPVSFSVTATGTGPLAFAWYKNGLPISGATSSSLTIPSAQVADMGNYVCRVSNPVGSDLSWSASLTLYAPGRLVPSATTLRFEEGTPFAVDVEHGATVTTQSLKLVNAGLQPLSFTGGTSATRGLAISGPNASDFGIASVSPATNQALNAGTTLTLVIEFHPSAVMRTLGLNANLLITTDSPLTPTLQILLLGDAVPVALSRFQTD